MKVARIGHLIHLYEHILNLGSGAGGAIQGGVDFKITEEQWSICQDVLSEFMVIAESLELGMSRMLMSDALAALRTVSPVNGMHTIRGQALTNIAEPAARLQAILSMELESKRLLLITDIQAKMLGDTDAPWGPEFAAKFPSAAYDLEQGVRCAAVHCYTASVFHLIRVLEVGIRAMRLCIGVTAPLEGPERNWGNMLNAIKVAIAAKPKGWKDKDLFSELHALLDSVRFAWRNNTMHVERKYIEEEVARMAPAVKGLMQRIADRMDENGEPKA